MIYKSDEQVEKELLALKEEGATHQRWNDKVLIKGTGRFKELEKEKIYEVHKLVAANLIKKGYAEITVNKN